MEKYQQYHINISAPNLVNVCVDKSIDGDMSGRLYHCYSRESWEFSNVVQLLNLMEELFDAISFPQASTESRYFVKPVKRKRRIFDKVAEQKDIINHTGERGTFVTFVRYRQNSAWQGELVWMEKGIKEPFFSTLEFIKLVNNSLVSRESS